MNDHKKERGHQDPPENCAQGEKKGVVRGKKAIKGKLSEEKPIRPEVKRSPEKKANQNSDIKGGKSRFGQKGGGGHREKKQNWIKGEKGIFEGRLDRGKGIKSQGGGKKTP